MNRWMEPTRLRRCRGGALALLLLCGTASSAPPALDFGHFALRTTSVTVRIDGADVRTDVAYRGFTTRLPVSAGTHLISAVDDKGQVIAERRLELRDGDGLTLFLAGEGSERAPHEIRTSVDHNLPIAADSTTVQITNLALPPSAGRFVPGVFTARRCSPTLPLNFSGLGYGYGSDGSDVENFRTSDANLSRGSTFGCPLLLSLNEDGDGAVEFSHRSQGGERGRVVLAGDGVEQPLEIVYLTQAIEPALPALTPSAAFDGLWHDPLVPGAAWELAFEPQADGTPVMRAIIFTYDIEQRPRWRLFDGTRVQRVVGGTPEGARATQRFSLTTARLLIHSCSRATFVPDLGSEVTGIPGGSFPRQAISLFKLLPVGGCLNPDIGNNGD